MTNPRLALAEEFVLHTRQNLFLTGRAGTGKTTFLRSVLKKTSKRYVIVAPTGVAAINAGGTTIHSLLHFPLTAFVPDQTSVDPNIAANRLALAKHLRYRKEKIDMLRQLELLVIDEISMVRVDLLDAIDFALRRTRKKDHPFGGVQLLVLGDLFQLAPVVKPQVWNILRNHYASPYFFDALSWKKSHPITIELTKIYRQRNAAFIDILNRMRNGKSTPSDISTLNQKYVSPDQIVQKNRITLTTHNHKADKINGAQMSELDSKPYHYQAIIEDKFSEGSFPADETLTLKVGAQVMFIRNDPENRFFNGKLAEVTSTSRDGIEVKLFNGDYLEVEKATWESKKYELNKETNEIEPKILGSFTQYPLRLAWAITVHKSQGLTFEQMVVDLGDTFSSGQAYVALSRCTSLEGLVLSSKMTLQNVIVNEEIVRYHHSAPQEHQLSRILETAKMRFAAEQLIGTFSFDTTRYQLEDWLEVVKESKVPQLHIAMELAETSLKNIKDIQGVSAKFQRQLRFLLSEYQASKDIEPIQQRTTKASIYFADQFYQGILHPFHLHKESLAYKAKARKYIQGVKDLLLALWSKLDQLYKPAFLGHELFQGKPQYDRASLKNTVSATTTRKKKKGASLDDTFELYKSVKSVEKVAALRGLAISTIESHIVKLIGQERLPILDVLDLKTVEEISESLLKRGDASLSEVKRSLSSEISYSTIRMVKAHLQTLDAHQREND